MVWFSDCGLSLNAVVCLGCFAGVLSLLVGLAVLIVAFVEVFVGLVCFVFGCFTVCGLLFRWVGCLRCLVCFGV